VSSGTGSGIGDSDFIADFASQAGRARGLFELVVVGTNWTRNLIMESGSWAIVTLGALVACD